ncbi:MAG: prolipoprotein diacylglyceryl transferase [Petrimonas sp.]|jgi:prolipoprotein diacylglyceryl transferase|nr:MAG: Prolipoprotein diacylglyceryl transferase [Bacteroidetes bacterium ADurb.BinA174]
MIPLSIDWNFDPELFTILGREIRWYGLFWVAGLIVAWYIVYRMFKHEKLPDKWYESLSWYMIIAIVVGARLGHCLFYDPEYFLARPLEMILPISKNEYGNYVFSGYRGLASHGGVIGIIIAVWLYSRKITKKSMLWTFDRVVVPAGFTAGMIRLGNLANHEIYGGATDLPWGFRFIENLPQWEKGAPAIYSMPSHPTQIYEAICYFIIFAITMWMYWKTNARERQGLIIGVAMIGIFIARFIIEFLKNVQEPFEVSMRDNYGLVMGQLLSIPFIIWGIWLIWQAIKRKPEPVAQKTNIDDNQNVKPKK